MTEGFWIAFFTALPPTIVAFAGALISLWNAYKGNRIEKKSDAIGKAVDATNGGQAENKTLAAHITELKAEIVRLKELPKVQVIVPPKEETK